MEDQKVDNEVGEKNDEGWNLVSSQLVESIHIEQENTKERAEKIVADIEFLCERYTSENENVVAMEMICHGKHLQSILRENLDFLDGCEEILGRIKTCILEFNASMKRKSSFSWFGKNQRIGNKLVDLKQHFETLHTQLTEKLGENEAWKEREKQNALDLKLKRLCKEAKKWNVSLVELADMILSSDIEFITEDIEEKESFYNSSREKISKIALDYGIESNSIEEIANSGLCAVITGTAQIYENLHNQKYIEFNSSMQGFERAIHFFFENSTALIGSADSLKTLQSCIQRILFAIKALNSDNVICELIWNRYLWKRLMLLNAEYCKILEEFQKRLNLTNIESITQSLRVQSRQEEDYISSMKQLELLNLLNTTIENPIPEHVESIAQILQVSTNDVNQGFVLLKENCLRERLDATILVSSIRDEHSVRYITCQHEKTSSLYEESKKELERESELSKRLGQELNVEKQESSKMSQEIRKLSKDLDELEKLKGVVQQSLQRTTNDLNDATAENGQLKKQLEQVSQNLDAAVLEKDKSFHELNLLQDAMTQCRLENEGLQQSLQRNTNDLNDATAENEQLKKRLEQVSQSLDAAVLEKDKAFHELNLLQNAMTQCQLENEGLQQSLQRTTNDLNDATAENKQLKKQLEQVSQSLDASMLENRQLETLEELQKSLNAAKVKNDQLEHMLEKLKVEYEEKNKSLKLKNDELNRSNGQIQLLNSRLKQLNESERNAMVRFRAGSFEGQLLDQISREEAENLLRDQTPGSFIIRTKERGSLYCLSALSSTSTQASNFVHALIHKTQEGYVIEYSENCYSSPYPTIQELLDGITPIW